MICALILACNRPKALNLSLYSWSVSTMMPITLSLDCMDKRTVRIANYWNLKMPNLEVKPSFQMFEKETGSQALKTDERITRHWISSITRLFFRKNCDYVVYTEEDHIIGKNFEPSLQAILPLF